MKAFCISFQVVVRFVISYWANQFVVLPSKKFGKYCNLFALIFFPFVAQILVNCWRWEIGSSLSWYFSDCMHNTFPIVATIDTGGTNGCACCNIIMGRLVVIIGVCCALEVINSTKLWINLYWIVPWLLTPSKLNTCFHSTLKTSLFDGLFGVISYNFSKFVNHEYFHYLLVSNECFSFIYYLWCDWNWWLSFIFTKGTNGLFCVFYNCLCYQY